LCATFSNLPSGSYTLSGLLNGRTDWAGYNVRTVSLSGSGHYCFTSYLGIRNSDTIAVQFSGPWSGTASTNNWDAISGNNWQPGLNN
jgi:hypothetical protein